MSETKYGILPMSQGGLTYKAIQQRTKMGLEMMLLSNEQAINFAKAYAGYDENGKLDTEHGIVGEYVTAAFDAADSAGDAYRQDAINSLIQAGVGTAAIVGTAATYYLTSNAALDADIEDASAMQKDLDAPYKGGLGQAEKLGAEDVTPLEKQAIDQKLKDWSEVGGSSFKNYQKVEANLSGKDLEEANLDRQLNKKAIEAAKAPEYRAKIQKNLEEHIKELNEQRRALSQKFNNFIQTVNMFQPDLLAIGQTRQNFCKADLETRSQQRQAEAQVLNSAAQKQSAFIDTEQQEAARFKEQADADASSLGQIQQTRGG